MPTASDKSVPDAAAARDRSASTPSWCRIPRRDWRRARQRRPDRVLDHRLVHRRSLRPAPDDRTPAQQAILESWLDQGNHTLLIFSQNIVYDLRQTDWIGPETPLPGELRRRARLLGRRRRSPQRDLQRHRRDRDTVRLRDLPGHHRPAARQHRRRHQPGDGDRHPGDRRREPGQRPRRARAGRHHRRPQVGRRRAQLEGRLCRHADRERPHDGRQQHRPAAVPRGARLHRSEDAVVAA